MKKVVTLAAILVAVAIAGYGFNAFAADVKATVTGKVEVKAEKVDGKDVKVTSIAVAEAKGEDNKAIADLKGKVLKVVGAKVADVEKLAGKEVEAKGVVKEAKEMDVTSVVDKTPVPKPAAPKPAAPKK
jgi:hypothetical protein